MSSFPDFLHALGLRPTKPIVPDGEIYRCPTESKPRRKNGAYMLAVGGGFGWAQDWTTMTEAATWHPEGQHVPDDFDPAALKRQWAEKREAYREGSLRALRYYQDAKPLRGGHPYLEAQGLDMTGCYGLRVDRRGWLVVPGRIGSELVTYQKIAPDGTKRFAPGAPTSGSSYRIESRSPTVNVICEGLATGLALYRAVPHCRIIVAWSTGNLSRLDDIPAGLTVFAADNDAETEDRIGRNPGIEAAQEAADALGCGVAYPEGLEGTDWADYRLERVESMSPPFGGRAEAERIVDGEIRTLVMREARFVR